MAENSTESSTPVQDVVMRRFWLFGGDTHYASGGMYDFRGSFDSVDDARVHALTAPMYVKDPQMGPVRWWHVFDCVLRYVVTHSTEQAYGAENLPNFDA